VRGYTCPDPDEDVDKDELEEKIEAAYTAKVGIMIAANAGEVPEGIFWVTLADMNSLNTAIDVAEIILAAEVSQALVDGAVTALNTAINTFNNAIKPGEGDPVDFDELLSAIETANEVKIGVITADNGNAVAFEQFWVTSLDMITFNAAIAAAEAVLTTALTQGDIDNAVTVLNAAITVFNTAKQSGDDTGSGNEPGDSNTLTYKSTASDGSIVELSINKKDSESLTPLADDDYILKITFPDSIIKTSFGVISFIDELGTWLIADGTENIFNAMIVDNELTAVAGDIKFENEEPEFIVKILTPDEKTPINKQLKITDIDTSLFSKGILADIGIFYTYDEGARWFRRIASGWTTNIANEVILDLKNRDTFLSDDFYSHVAIESSGNFTGKGMFSVWLWDAESPTELFESIESGVFNVVYSSDINILESLTTMVFGYYNVNDSVGIGIDDTNKLHFYINYSSWIYQGDIMEVRTNFNDNWNSDVSYIWYLNGEMFDDTGNSILIDTTDLSIGMNYGLAIITINGTAFAKEFSFWVEE